LGATTDKLLAAAPAAPAAGRESVPALGLIFDVGVVNLTEEEERAADGRLAGRAPSWR